MNLVNDINGFNNGGLSFAFFYFIVIAQVIQEYSPNVKGKFSPKMLIR